jgi:hypothetical protein
LADPKGNSVTRHQFLGNLIFDDIFDPNPVGANIYHSNLREVSQVGPAPATNVCIIPDLAGHDNGEGDE